MTMYLAVSIFVVVGYIFAPTCAGCINIRGDDTCEHWKSSGFCTSPGVQENCKKSCGYCGPGYVPASCKPHITYSFQSGKNHILAPIWFPEMKRVTGVTPKDATFDDFQREFKCKNIHGADCNDKGLQFPLTCSFPPCYQCIVKDMCIDTAAGHLDTYNSGCFPYYARFPSRCGLYDDEDFQAKSMCCYCGGGNLKEPRRITVCCGLLNKHPDMVPQVTWGSMSSIQERNKWKKHNCDDVVGGSSRANCKKPDLITVCCGLLDKHPDMVPRVTWGSMSSSQERIKWKKHNCDDFVGGSSKANCKRGLSGLSFTKVCDKCECRVATNWKETISLDECKSRCLSNDDCLGISYWSGLETTYSVSTSWCTDCLDPESTKPYTYRANAAYPPSVFRRG